MRSGLRTQSTTTQFPSAACFLWPMAFQGKTFILSRELLFLKGKNSSPPSMILNGKILSNIPYSWQRDQRMQKGGGYLRKVIGSGEARGVSFISAHGRRAWESHPALQWKRRSPRASRCGDGGGPTTDCSSPLEGLFELLEIVWIFSENKLPYLERSQCDQEEVFSEKQWSDTCLKSMALDLNLQ